MKCQADGELLPERKGKSLAVWFSHPAECVTEALQNPPIMHRGRNIAQHNRRYKNEELFSYVFKIRTGI